MALPPLESEATRLGRRQIIHAATIVGVAFIFSRLLGVVRDAVINFYFDIDSLEANAYFIASRFPETIFYIIAGGALGSAFIPTFTAYFVRQDEAGGWHLFSAVANLVVLVTTAVAGLMAVFSPQIIAFFYPDLAAGDPALLATSAALLRVMLLTPIIFGLSGVTMAALNARQHFLLPAVAPIVYNLGIIAGTILFAPNVMGLAYGAVAGALGHLLVQLPALAQNQARYRPVVSLRDPGVRQVLRLMAPRVLGLSFGQLNHLLTQFLAQAMVIGSIPALGYAWRIMIMPQGIVGQALGIAAFPTFSTLAAQRALDEMRRILADTLRLIAFLTLPVTALLMILARPIVAVLFERGEFDPRSTEFVAWALLLYAISLAGLSAIEILSRAFYALEDTRTPVLAGLFQLIGMGLLGMWLSRAIFPRLGWLAFGGLALGYSLSTLIELGLLMVLLRRKLGGLNGRHLWSGLWRMALATAVMAAVVWLALQALGPLPELLELAVGSLIAAAAYVLALLLLQVPEPGQLLGTLRRRNRG